LLLTLFGTQGRFGIKWQLVQVQIRKQHMHGIVSPVPMYMSLTWICTTMLEQRQKDQGTKATSIAI
jgi:hypothetical protein